MQFKVTGLRASGRLRGISAGRLYYIQDDFSWDGCKMQHKKYSNSRIALLNVELELQVEKDIVEIGDHRV